MKLSAKPTRASAFTLVELMISIALVLVLMIGINKVFDYTTRAVGQGQAFGGAIRDSRALQQVLNHDLSSFVPNGSGPNDAACVIITSSALPIFSSRADQQTDLDGNPLTVDINSDGKEGDTTVPGEVISPAIYNYRNHRQDVLSFFARDLFTARPET